MSEIDRKRRLAHDLNIIATVQLIALVVALVFQVIFHGNYVPDNTEWDTIHGLCGVASLGGIVAFFIAAIWGSCKLLFAPSTTLGTRVYAYGLWIYALLIYLLAFFTYVDILAIFYPFYSIIPLFCIARRLANGAKHGII